MLLGHNLSSLHHLCHCRFLIKGGIKSYYSFFLSPYANKVNCAIIILVKSGDIGKKQFDSLAFGLTVQVLSHGLKIHLFLKLLV